MIGELVAKMAGYLISRVFVSLVELASMSQNLRQTTDLALQLLVLLCQLLASGLQPGYLLPQRKIFFLLAGRCQRKRLAKHRVTGFLTSC